MTRLTHLGQAEPATSFTQPHNTVNLNESMLPKVLTFGILAGAFYFAAKGLLRPASYGRDGIDELAYEAKRIQRRVAARRRRSQRR